MTSSRTLAEFVIAEVSKTYPEDDTSGVRRAVQFAQEYGGDGCVSQGLAAAQALAKMHLDPDALTACILSSVPAAKLPLPLDASFGPEVVTMVEGVHRVQAVRWDRLEQEAAESLRKMFIAMAAEVRVVMIVLALQVQRLQLAADALDPIVRERAGNETLQVYGPLANRLGVWQLKSQLEDLSLKCLRPETYDALDMLLRERRQQRVRLIQQAIDILRGKLSEQRIQATVNGRAKHLYSIFKKMERKGVGLDQIHDVNAVRVITEQLSDCYGVLGLVHSLWIPLPGQFDDYIARPKDNLYRSLHTTVVGPEGKPLEVQIRTREMHEYAEYGVAAHWAYKEQRKANRQADSKFVVLRQLMDWERDVADPHQFAERLKTDVFRDQVYVFTPAGDIVDLPSGATPLDFAYRIHTMVGHRCRGARVNDQIVSLDYQLKTGDRVEILTHKHPSPSRDWLHPGFGYLHTSSARGKVRQWFRDQGRDAAVQQGKEIVERELGRLGLSHVTQTDMATRFGYGKLEDLYAAVGFGVRSSHALASVALQIERQKAPPPDVPTPVQDHVSQPKAASGLSVSGVDDILGKRARCCTPVPGDPVLGFVSRGRGIIIHRKDCPVIDTSKEPQRWVQIDWGPQTEERHTVDLEIIAQDRHGLLKDLTTLITHTSADVRAVKADVKERQSQARIVMRLDIVGSEQLLQVLDKLERFADVQRVRRIGKK